MAKQWIKLYTEILSDAKMGRMSDKLFRRTIELFLIAGREDTDGALPPVDDLAWHLHTSAKDVMSILDELISLKIVERTSEGFMISHFAERQNSDMTRSEINRRYYENSKKRASEIQTDVRPDSDVTASEIQTDVNLNSDMGQSEIQTLEIEEEKIKNKNKNIKTLTSAREKTAAAKPAPEKQKYGSLQNVLLTPQEYARLCERFPDADSRIENLSLGIASKGYKYKDHYATILNWARMDEEREAAKPKAKQPENEYPDFYSKLEAEGML